MFIIKTMSIIEWSLHTLRLHLTVILKTVAIASNLVSSAVKMPVSLRGYFLNFNATKMMYKCPTEMLFVERIIFILLIAM